MYGKSHENPLIDSPILPCFRYSFPRSSYGRIKPGQDEIAINKFLITLFPFPRKIRARSQGEVAAKANEGKERIIDNNIKI